MSENSWETVSDQSEIDDTENKSCFYDQQNSRSNAEEEQEQKDIFTDPKGLYLKGPQLLGKVLVKGEDNKVILKIEEMEKQFPFRTTQTNVCTNYFEHGDEYYTCDNCCFNSLFTTMCYCIGCFDESKHMGHNYRKNTCYNSDAYCDCGRPTRMKPESFCVNHKNYKQKINVEYGEGQQAKFLELFTSLLRILKSDNQTYQSQFQELSEKVNKLLYKLNKKSVYYNRLSYKLILKPLEADKEDNSSFQLSEKIAAPLSYSEYGKKFMTQIVGDNQTKVNLAKYIVENNQQGYHCLNFLDEQLFGDLQSLSQLAERGCFIEQRHNKYVEFSRKSEEGQQLLYKLIANAHSKKTKSEYFNFIEELLGYEQIKITNSRFLRFLLQTLLSYYQTKDQVKDNKVLHKRKAKISKKTHTPHKKAKREKKSHKIQEEESQCEEEESDRSESSSSSSESNTSVVSNDGLEDYRLESHNILRIILMCLSLYSKGKAEIISNIYNGNQLKDISFSNLTVLMSKVVKGLFNLLIDVDRENLSQIIPIMLIIQEIADDQNNKSSKKIMAQFWETILEQGHHLTYCMDAVYQVITYLINWNIITKRNQAMKKSGENEGVQENYDEQQKWFKSFLYENQNIQKQDLWIRRQSKQISFPKAGKILSHLCKYNPESQCFEYCSDEKYPNIQLKFSLRKYRDDCSSILSNKFNYNQELNVTGYKKKLIESIFLAEDKDNNNIFFKRFKELWLNTLKQIETDSYLQESMKSAKCSFVYLFLLNVVDKLTHGQNKDLHAELQLVRSNEQELFKYNYLSEPEDIQRLLCLNSEEASKQKSPQKKRQEEEKEKKEQEAMNSRKQKLEELKKKKYEKLNKQRNKVLKRLESRTDSAIIDDDEDVCILCHERSKKDNELVYLADINKNSTLCGAFYGDENKTQAFINICFHTVHINCFIKMDERECPLCSKRINCVFPVNFVKTNKKLNRICSNIIISVMVSTFKVYDIENHFILILRHLIESYGLNSLVTLSKYEIQRKIKAKTDAFLLEFAKQIYQNASGEQRQSFDESVETLIAEIKNCKQKIYEHIQLLFTYIIFTKIKQSQAYKHPQEITAIMKQLKKTIIVEEYDLIEESIEMLTGEIIDSELTEQEKKQILPQQQKKSLSFTIEAPPSNAQLLVKFTADKNCESCSRMIQYMCLICKKNFCDECLNRQNHNKMHGDYMLLLSIQDANLIAHKKNYNQSCPIYIDDFKLPYEMRNSFEWIPLTDYRLDEVKLNKILANFLSD